MSRAVFFSSPWQKVDGTIDKPLKIAYFVWNHWYQWFQYQLDSPHATCDETQSVTIWWQQLWPNDSEYSCLWPRQIEVKNIAQNGQGKHEKYAEKLTQLGINNDIRLENDPVGRIYKLLSPTFKKFRQSTKNTVQTKNCRHLGVKEQHPLLRLTRIQSSHW